MYSATPHVFVKIIPLDGLSKVGSYVHNIYLKINNIHDNLNETQKFFIEYNVRYV
jgi:hypothetical protein